MNYDVNFATTKNTNIATHLRDLPVTCAPAKAIWTESTSCISLIVDPPNDKNARGVVIIFA